LQAVGSKMLKGTRSILLAGLMVGGFTLRVLLSSHLTVPRVLELSAAIGVMTLPL
jgi:esterase/lipase